MSSVYAGEWISQGVCQACLHYSWVLKRAMDNSRLHDGTVVSNAIFAL